MEFRDLKSQYQYLKEPMDSAIQRVLNRANYISGEEVRELESQLKQYVGVKHCISCANGTDALSLVLRAWGIKKGDAVFVPDFTFFASAEVVSLMGATPVFVDVDSRTFNMNPVHLESKIKQVIKEGTLIPKVIMPVDLFGLLADYSAIRQIAKKYGLLILEDGAQGFGAEFKGQKACSFGDAATTSFFPAKPLGCYGDGGAIFTNDDSLAALLESLRVHGKGEDKYDNVRIGVNSRLDTFQAAILLVKLDALIKKELDAVNQVYNQYTELLSDYVITPLIPDNYRSSFAQYTIQLPSKEIRDGLKEYLHHQGIPSMVYYTKTMHQQTAYATYKITDSEYPVSARLCETVLSLPMHPYMTKENILFVINSIKRYLVLK